MKIGIIIVSYNRPDYFKQCLESFQLASIPKDTTVVLIDDASSDLKTIELFNSFSLKDINVIKIRNSQNKKIPTNLKVGFDMCFSNDCDIVMNFDSDAIIKKDAIQKLVELKGGFNNNIVTGFNCTTKNLNGSERHKILYKGLDYNTKKSVGGINFVLSKKNYDEWVLPALNTSIHKGGNWDHMSCINSEHAERDIVCIVPSVVQHIGIVSSMGHSSIEPPDVADDFDERLNLPNVTLIGLDCLNLERLIKARNQCTKGINFGAVKLLSSINSDDPTVIKIDPISSKEAYSHFIMKSLYKHIDTEYCLIFQYDGYVVDATKWNDNFLNYDYIGATWWFKDSMNVGNGGFSLRSRRLCEITAFEEKITVCHPEDEQICRIHRKFLEEKYAIKFATEDIANRFAIEAFNSVDHTYSGQFGVHGTNVKGTPLYQAPRFRPFQKINYI